MNSSIDFNFKNVIITAAGIGMLYFLYLISPILLPFIIALIIAYISNPLVIKITQFNIPHKIAVTIVILLIISVIFLLIYIIDYVIESQLPQLIDLINRIQPWVHDKINLLYASNMMSQNTKNISTVSQNIMKNSDIISWIFKTMFVSGRTVLDLMVMLVLVPILVFYFLYDSEKMKKNMISFIPKSIRHHVIELAKECDAALGAFFRGQLLVMLSLSVFYSITFSLIGLEASVVLGIFVGISSIIPYLGAIVSILIISMITLLQFGALDPLVWIGLIFIIGHIGENFYLSPVLIGNRINLHPVTIIFVILAGGTLFGFIGVLFAIPISAILSVIAKSLYKNFNSMHQLHTL